MVAYQCDGQGAKSAAVAVERSSKHTLPHPQGSGRQQKDCFLYVRSHQLVEKKGRRVQNEAKNEAKIDLNEAKMEAKKSKNSAICAKRSEDPQSKGAGFDEPQGGYMKVEFEARGSRDGCRSEREKGW
jgi:hypothetical protein